MRRQLGALVTVVGVGCALWCGAGSPAREPEVRAGSASSAALEALPWEQRIGLERLIAETDARYAPRIEGGVEGRAARLEARDLTARVASTAHLTIGARDTAVEATLRATSIDRGERRVPLAEVPAQIEGVEVRAERAPGVVEWWRELPSGLEHGVTIAERPEGEGALEVELKVHGVETRSAGGDIELVHEGQVVARYAHLAVLDATGARVPARMRASAAGITIEVDDAEAEYPVVIDPLFVVAQEATLVAPDGAAGDWFGWSVALTSSGDRALVGAPSDDTAGGAYAGSARVFVRTGTSWAQEATLVAPDGVESDQFGYSVALTSSGDRALVGAPTDDTAGGIDAGSARVFVRTGTSWAQEATLVAPDGAADDYLGYSVALTSSGDRALVGAPTAGINVGSARVFVRTGTSWAQEATLVAPDGAAGDRFGFSVALTSSGDRALVGASRDDIGRRDGAGSARVFVRTGTTWTEEATLAAPDGAEFGYSVALTASGDRALVGMPYGPGGTETGSAYAFLRTGTTWAQEAVLVAPDGAEGDEFGSSVALSASGDRALVGAYGDDTVGSGAGVGHADAGSARVFVRTGTSWAQDATLVAPDEAVGDCFGWSVALTSSGDRALVGGYLDDTGGGSDAGSARVFSIRPADANGTACTAGDTCLSGFCADGVCCDTVCGGGSGADCQGCSAALTGGPAGTCAPLANGTLCRAASGACDADERCDGTSFECPVDALEAAGATCRAAEGPCDAVEQCDGSSSACPTDAFLTGTECRASAGACDAPEVCLGDIATCPADQFSPSGTVCRASTDLSCDPLESCDGTSAACPADETTCAPRPDSGPIDVGVGVDAGPLPEPVAACSCRVGGHASASPVALLLLLFGLALVHRRGRAR